MKQSSSMRGVDVFFKSSRKQYKTSKVLQGVDVFFDDVNDRCWYCQRPSGFFYRLRFNSGHLFPEKYFNAQKQNCTVTQYSFNRGHYKFLSNSAGHHWRIEKLKPRSFEKISLCWYL